MTQFQHLHFQFFPPLKKDPIILIRNILFIYMSNFRINDWNQFKNVLEGTRSSKHILSLSSSPKSNKNHYLNQILTKYNQNNKIQK